VEFLTTEREMVQDIIHLCLITVPIFLIHSLS
jgi:hypothetical protein